MTSRSPPGDPRVPSDDPHIGEARPTVDDPRVGLCARCAHGRAVRSSKGSTFWLCHRSTTDARYPKYPRLPVIRCSGFEPA